MVKEWDKAIPKLKFNAKNHTYKIGRKKLIPVSTLLSIYFGKVDAKVIARKVNKIPNSKYYKKGIRKILSEWKNISDNGTLVHKQIEDYILFNIEPGHEKAKQAARFIDAELDNYYEPLMLTELQLYNERLGVAGTADLVVLDENDMRMTLYDWKTNNKIDDKEYQKMHIPVKGLKNTKLQKYQMQLSIYAYLLQLNGYKVRGINLVHLTGDKPKVYKLPLLTNIAKYMCENYRRDEKNGKQKE